MRSNFWEPNVVDMSGEKRSFEKMSPAEQFVFTSNLSRQILLDTIQGRAPMLAFAPYCTDPMLENCISTWSFFETIHSESYTHIIRAIYPDPSVVVDAIPKIKEIAECAKSISEAYDRLQRTGNKENLYLALIAANALEGLRFYVSFACTFSFAERGFVEGSAKVVKLIARDEIQHLALTKHILKQIQKDDPEYTAIATRLADKALSIFKEAAEQEKEWAKFLFSRGPILGLSEEILSSYIDHLFHKLTSSLGLPQSAPKTENPIPWIDKWFTSSNAQEAPQETEKASYLSSVALENDLNTLNIKEILNINKS